VSHAGGVLQQRAELGELDGVHYYADLLRRWLPYDVLAARGIQPLNQRPRQ